MTSQPEKRARALELHLAGATYQVIADQLGYASKASAHKLVQDALDELVLPAQSADALQTAVARLDAMLVGLWPKARRGDGAAVDRVLRIEERRMALAALAVELDATSTKKETGLNDFEKRLRARESGAKGARRAKSG